LFFFNPVFFSHFDLAYFWKKPSSVRFDLSEWKKKSLLCLDLLYIWNKQRSLHFDLIKFKNKQSLIRFDLSIV
jgi:hypothetical protein